MLTDSASISTIKAFLDSRFGADWVDMEVGVFLMEEDVEPSPLLQDKLLLAQALEEDRERFYDEVLFFLYSSCVINNRTLDLSYIPTLLSPEAAYSVYEVQKVFPLESGFSFDVQRYLEEVLKEDGFDYPVWPFTFLDTRDFSGSGPDSKKEKGIRMYIAYMERQND